jgi:hypothetical protein
MLRHAVYILMKNLWEYQKEAVYVHRALPLQDFAPKLSAYNLYRKV